MGLAHAWWQVRRVVDCTVVSLISALLQLVNNFFRKKLMF